MQLDVFSLKASFSSILLENVKRDGVYDLLDYLQSTDFFSAPASSKFHMACPGGLVQHSLSVWKKLMDLCDSKCVGSVKYTKETLTLVGLLHDLCKVNFYTEDTKNVKDPVTGVWNKVPYYAINDSFPYGHGEKSVYLVNKFIRLTDEEAMAIRWHMSGWDSASRGGDCGLSTAYEKYPLCCLLSCADIMSTYLDERV